MAPLGYPASLTTLGTSWLQSHFGEFWYLSISTLSCCCWEQPSALSDALMYLQFTSKSIGIDGFGSCRRQSPAGDGSVSITAPGTGTLRKCWLLCSPLSVQRNENKAHNENMCWLYIKAQLSNILLQWKVHSTYMNENQLIVTMCLSKTKIKSFTNLYILWRGGYFFLIRIKNIIYLKRVHAYSSGAAYGNTYDLKIKLFFPRRK